MSHFASILNQFELSFAAISESDLNEFEMRMTQKLHQENHLATSEKIQLPQDYRQFLIDINGGVSYIERFKGAYGQIDCAAMFFYGYYPVHPEEDVKGIYSNNLASEWTDYDMYREYLDEQIAIPIIELYHFSRALLILTGPERGMIYKYNDWGVDDNIVVKIANDFDELIQGADYGEYIGDDFFFDRFLKKCTTTNNLQALLDYLDSQEFEDEALESMLSDALELAYLPAVEKLIEMGASCPKWNIGRSKTIEIAKLMKRQGKSVNDILLSGSSALGVAIFNSDVELVKYLIAQGADIHYINSENGNSIIMEAQEQLAEYEAAYFRDYTKEIANLKAIIAYLESLG